MIGLHKLKCFLFFFSLKGHVGCVEQPVSQTFPKTKPVTPIIEGTDEEVFTSESG